MILFAMSLIIIVFSVIVLMGTLFRYAYQKRDWKLLGLLSGYHLFLLYGVIFYSLLSP